MYTFHVHLLQTRTRWDSWKERRGEYPIERISRKSKGLNQYAIDKSSVWETIESIQLNRDHFMRPTWQTVPRDWSSPFRKACWKISRFVRFLAILHSWTIAERTHSWVFSLKTQVQFNGYDRMQTLQFILRSVLMDDFLHGWAHIPATRTSQHIQHRTVIWYERFSIKHHNTYRNIHSWTYRQ